MANEVCTAMDLEISKLSELEPMFAPKAPYISLFALWSISLGLFILSTLTLSGVKVKDALNSNYIARRTQNSLHAEPDTAN